MLTNLRHRVAVQAETRTTFSGGAYTTSWSTSSTEWANVQVDNANESYDQDKKQQYTKYKVIMRQGTAVTNVKRLIYNNKTLVVESVQDPTQRSNMIILKCREENA